MTSPIGGGEGRAGARKLRSVTNRIDSAAKKTLTPFTAPRGNRLVAHRVAVLDEKRKLHGSRHRHREAARAGLQHPLLRWRQSAGNLPCSSLLPQLAPQLANGFSNSDGLSEAPRIRVYMNYAPKKFRFAVLRTPIEIRGTLRHPAVGLKGSKLLAQGAVATVLGAIGTPLAAIAAFVDPGLNKSADCRALIADAKAMGAPVRTAAARPRKRAREHKER